MCTTWDQFSDLCYQQGICPWSWMHSGKPRLNPWRKQKLKMSYSFACSDLYKVDWRITCRFILHPNPAFIPKLIKPGYSFMEVEVQAFHSPLSESPWEESLQHLCPVRGLWIYLYRIQSFRQLDILRQSLCVFCKPQRRGKHCKNNNFLIG